MLELRQLDVAVDKKVDPNSSGDISADENFLSAQHIFREIFDAKLARYLGDEPLDKETIKLRPIRSTSIEDAIKSFKQRAEFVVLNRQSQREYDLEQIFDALDAFKEVYAGNFTLNLQAGTGKSAKKQGDRTIAVVDYEGIIRQIDCSHLALLGILTRSPWEALVAKDVSRPSDKKRYSFEDLEGIIGISSFAINPCFNVDDKLLYGRFPVLPGKKRTVSQEAVLDMRRILNSSLWFSDLFSYIWDVYGVHREIIASKTKKIINNLRERGSDIGEISADQFYTFFFSKSRGVISLPLVSELIEELKDSRRDSYAGDVPYSLARPINRLYKNLNDLLRPNRNKYRDMLLKNIGGLLPDKDKNVINRACREIYSYLADIAQIEIANGNVYVHQAIPRPRARVKLYVIKGRCIGFSDQILYNRIDFEHRLESLNPATKPSIMPEKVA